MNVPNVSWNDIVDFQVRHFSGSQVPACMKEQGIQDDEDDDGLGYYSDGTKRTLTDEQVAIFRHSELQALIKAHRIAAEENEEEAEVSQPTQSLEFATESRSSLLLNSKPKSFSPSPPVSKPNKTRNRVKKKSRKPQYRPKQQDVESFTADGQGRTFRRLCREADEVKPNAVELDY